ncbi:MAG: ankyrin repeat domain-containing protein [Gemmatimonas sp.]
MSLESDLLVAFEVHSPGDIQSLLAAGASPTARIDGKTPIECFVEGYLRSPRFAECLRVLLDAGGTIGHPALEAVLLDDDGALRRLIDRSPDEVHRRLRVRTAFTSCMGVSPLHICAEFNSVRCARTLLEHGADVNAKADMNADGFGGQTAVFHAVNSIHNYSRPVLEVLVEAGATLDERIKGVVWGVGQQWETLVLDVTPLSYAQCGLYAQFHRKERDIYANLSYLFRKRYGTALPLHNVPNKYLAPRA